MDASPFVMILVSAAAIAGLWAFAIKIKTDNGYRDFLDWVRGAYPGQWNALPWGARVLFPRAGVSQLRRNGHDRDPEFERRYQAAKYAERRMLKPLLIGIACIALTIIGIKLFGWRW